MAIFVLAAIIPLLAFYFLTGFSWPEREATVVLGGQRIVIELAKTDQERKQGLSGRLSLEPNQGMLFLFPQKGRYSFWMKEMKFNLDFVFLDGEKIVDLVQNIPFPQKDQSTQFWRSEKEFDKVLEMNAGMIQQLGVKIGDEATSLIK